MTIYIVAHGHEMSKDLRAISFENNDTVTSDEFNEWLDRIVCGRMVILLDFCFSGKFAESLQKPSRLVISAAEDDKIAWYYWDWSFNETNRAVFGKSGSVFFHPFWKKLSNGSTIEEAFEYGDQECIRWGLIDPTHKNVTQNQNPQIYLGERNLLGKFAFYYPGGYDVFLVATLLVALIEIMIMFAAARTYLQTRDPFP